MADESEPYLCAACRALLAGELHASVGSENIHHENRESWEIALQTSCAICTTLKREMNSLKLGLESLDYTSTYLMYSVTQPGFNISLSSTQNHTELRFCCGESNEISLYLFPCK